MADKEKRCQPCLRENIQVPASVFCYDCEEELCEYCKKIHKKIKSLSDHRLCKLADGKSDISKLEFLRLLTRCPAHPAEEVRYLCEDHDHVCCNDCAIVKHRKCESLVSIANETSATDTAAQNISGRLESLKTYTNNFLDFEKKYNAAVETSKTKMKEKLKGLKGTIDEAFEKLENRVEHDIEEKYSVFLKKMEINVCEIKIIQRELDESVNKLNTVKELGKNNHLFLLHRKLNEVCVKFGSELSQIDFENKICCLEENSPSEVFRLVETAFRVSTEKCDIPMPEFPKLRNDDKPTSVNMNVVKHTLVCEQNLGNLGRFVSSCTWIRDLVVVAVHDSKVLALFELNDDKFNQCYEKRCSAQPWGLVSIDNERFVVCFPYEKRLEIMKLEGKRLQTVKTIKTDSEVWDIALMNTEEIITLSRSGYIDIYTLEGTKVRTLPLNTSSIESVVNAYAINYDRNVGVVYISAHGVHKIVALKVDGTVIFEYSDHLQFPWHIDITDNGDIYVPMFGTNAVHVLDRQGQFVRELEVPGPGFCINLRREKQEFLFISFTDNQSFLHLYRY